MKSQSRHHTWLRALALASYLLLQTAESAAMQADSPSSLPRLEGMTLAKALRSLQSEGLRIVFTTEVVRSDMRVEAEPTATDPRAILDEILAPHGLTIDTGPGDSLIVVRDPDPPPTEDAPEPPTPEALPMVEEELVVRPSRVSLLRQEPVAPLGMTRDEILALPHLSDDFYRALSLLPGVTSTDVTAQFHVRGGRRDETQILLDGQELFDAYHLKDYDSALSLVDSNTLGSADLTTGGYSAQFGDRMSGVLDMTTVTPSGPARGRASLSILNASLGGAGTFAEDRGEWLGEVRRGTIELVSELIGDEDPSYWDAYGKLHYRLDLRNSLRLNVLGSGDELTFSEVDTDGSSKDTQTEYDSRYGWVTHQLFASNRLFLDTAVSFVDIDRDRRGIEDDEDAAFEIRDLRDTQQVALRQGWNLEASQRHFLKWGFELRRWDTHYDYFAEKEFDNPVESEDEELVIFQQRFEEDHNSAYLSDRVRLADPLTLELGLRWDDYTQTSEDLFSPRINLAYSPGTASVIRIAWGHFNQSQRPYELEIADGETEFSPVEQSEHALIGFERIFETDGETQLALRVEAYHREIDNPRPRYENLYEPLNTFPEAEPDRVRIAPDRSESEGVEFFLRARHGSRIGWFVNYTYATIEDEIMGVWVPRENDQRHTVNIDFDYRIGAHWRLNVAWRYHSGWPTTPLGLEPEEDEDGELVFVPVLGELNSQRLAAYHRFDLRASRTWDIDWGKLGFFVDIQNLFDRDNIAGFDVSIEDEEGIVEFETEYWAGILPSFGLTLEF